MSTLIDKTYLLLPDEVLYNITRLSRFSMVAFSIKEDQGLANISLSFDKTSLNKKYAAKLKGKVKSSSVDLDSRRFTFDPDSPLKLPVKGSTDQSIGNVQGGQGPGTSNNPTWTPGDGRSLEASLTNDGNLNREGPIADEVTIKQEPVSDIDIKTEPSDQEPNTQGKKEKDCESKLPGKPSACQRELISFPLPAKTSSVQVPQTHIFQQVTGLGKKSDQTKPQTEPTKQRDKLQMECVKLSSKLSKVSLKDDYQKELATSDTSKKIPKEKESRKPGKDKVKTSKSDTRPDKENVSPYHETVKYFLHKAYQNIDVYPKKMSKYDWTYSIKDKDFDRFVIQYSDDKRRNASPVQIDNVTLTWLQVNGKQIPSYIRRQATYRIIQRDLSHCCTSDAVSKEKRKLINELLD